MDAELNSTDYITFVGHVDLQKYRYVYFVIIFIFYMLILCCNFTIVGLIATHKNLHKPMYIFIAALLINSVLYSTVIHPKLLMDFLSEHQITTFPRCIFQVTIHYGLAASEFLLLSAMAYDRYVSICRPLQYQNIMSRSTITVFLVLAWLLPACELTVIIVTYFNIDFCHFNMKSIFCNTLIYHLPCRKSMILFAFGFFILSSIILLPVLFILFTYTRILIVCSRSSGKVRSKAAQTCLPHLLVLINLSTFISYDIIFLRMGPELPKLPSLILSLQMTVNHPLLNPFIYGLKMKEISKHLKRLFQLKSH